MVAVADRLLTPAKITAWLDCAHYLTLKHEMESGTRDKPPSTFGEIAQMLLDKELVHEGNVLATYRANGRDVFEVSERGEHELFSAWVARVGGALLDGHDVVYQMPFVHDGIRGVADFFERSTWATARSPTSRSTRSSPGSSQARLHPPAQSRPPHLHDDLLGTTAREGEEIAPVARSVRTSNSRQPAAWPD